MKKVLVLTVTAGNGHNACAKSVQDKLNNLGDYEVKTVNLLKEYSTPNYTWLNDKGYSLTLSFFLPIYNYFYNNFDKLKPESRYSNIIKKVTLSCCEKLLKEINEFQPDIVYGTHFYVGAVLSFLKLAYNLPCKTVVSTLDYTNTPFWESSIGVDYLTIPNADFLQTFLNEGFAREQLVVTGLPCGEQFLKEEDKLEARKILGLELDKFTIMIMFGGGCWKGGYKILTDLAGCVKSEDVQIIMINGKNKKEYKKVEKFKQKHKTLKIINVGFTHEIATYMSATDVIINKMGGLTSTEAISKQVPCIATSRLPGQELSNLKYLEDKGVAKSFKNKKELKEIVNFYLKDKDAVDEVRAKMAKLRVDGINNVAVLLEKLPKAQYNQEYINSINYKEVEKNIKKAIKLLNKKENKKGV